MPGGNTRQYAGKRWFESNAKRLTKIRKQTRTWASGRRNRLGRERKRSNPVPRRARGLDRSDAAIALLAQAVIRYWERLRGRSKKSGRRCRHRALPESDPEQTGFRRRFCKDRPAGRR